MKPLVLLICKKDYANVAYTYREALKSVGVNAVAFSSKKHTAIQYPDVVSYFDHLTPTLKQPVVADAIKKARAIIWMHSQYIDLYLSDAERSKKKLLVFHGGTHYRKSFKKWNKVFNPLVDISLIQTLDLWGLGAKNPVWMLPAVDSKRIKPQFQPSRKRRIIAHYPHIAKFKGTEVVNRVLASLKKEKLKFEYKYSDEVLPWRENIKRIEGCDIYIESLSQDSGINKHDWSVTALEAASLGKIVVTNMLDPQRYKKEYGPCAVQVANTGEQLGRVLKRLLLLDEFQFQQLKWKSRDWIEKTHSYEVIGTRLKNILGI